MTFEDLDAWKKARELVNAVYKLTREAALCSQTQRAAESAMSNIAEGFERQLSGEKLQAYNIARASCGEVRSLLYVMEDNYAIHGRGIVDARVLVGEVGRLTSGLISSTRKRLAAKIGGAGASIAVVAWLCFQVLG